MESNYKFDTKAIHAGEVKDMGTNTVTVPIYVTNAYTFNSTEHAKNLFELKEPGNIYSRLQNPTNDALEEKIAALDGGVGALSFASGHAAIFSTIFALCGTGDEIVSSNSIYGGAINMLGVSLKKLGINVKFVDINDLKQVEDAITDKTKVIFTELIGNPNGNIADLEPLAEIAHKNGIPFIVDNTFGTPYLCRPIEFGADIVIHSATKFLGGHGGVMAGIVVDSGKFNYLDNPRFPDFNKPDKSYHGIVYAKDMGNAAFIVKLRAQTIRDYGACLSPFNAFVVMNGIDTLSLRMKKHCENALEVAKFLEKHPQVSFVNYAGLESSKYYDLAKKYLPNGVSSVFTFGLRGGREVGAKFIDNLNLVMNVANVGDVRSLVIHPATTTHSQLSDEQLAASGISADTIRLSIGIEDVEDIIADISNAIDIATK